jgi:hypothetical protein
LFIEHRFLQLTPAETTNVENLCRATTDAVISESLSIRIQTTSNVRKFSPAIQAKHKRLIGSAERNAILGLLSNGKKILAPSLT